MNNAFNASVDAAAMQRLNTFLSQSHELQVGVGEPGQNLQTSTMLPSENQNVSLGSLKPVVQTGLERYMSYYLERYMSYY